MRKFLVAVLVLLLFGASVGEAVPIDPDSPFIPYEMSVLPNGLRVIVREIPAYPIVAVNMWVEAGGRHDPEGKSGLAHFFEHMLFKGTETRPAGQIAREVESVGGYLNAMTSLEYTAYYIVVPSQHLELAMEIQSDAIQNSVFDPQEMAQEREVIDEEIRMREDSPSSALIDMALRELFAKTPYERPILGSVEDLDNIDREDMFAFHEQYYVPNNMVLVVAGDVDAQEVIDHAHRLYGDMEPASVPLQPHVPLPELEEVVQIEEKRDVEQSYLFMAFPGPGIGDRDAVALSTAGIVLGDGRASRLYQILREEKELVNSVSAGYSSFADVGLFFIRAELPPENREEVREILTREIGRLREEEVTEDELKRARAMVRSSFAFGAESNIDVALTMGRFETMAGVDHAVNRVAMIESVSARDIRRVAGEYLSSDAYLYCELDPEGGDN